PVLVTPRVIRGDDDEYRGSFYLSSDTIVGSDGLVVKDYIKEISDLKGKKIAVEVATDEHFLLHKALERGNLEEKDVTIIPTTAQEGIEKFIKGQVDACFTYDPYLTRGAKKGAGEILISTAEMKGIMIDTLVAKSKALEEREEDYINIIKAWYRAQEFVKNNPQEAYELMAAKENMSYQEFKNFYEEFTFFSLADNKETFTCQNFRNKLSEMNQFLEEKELISEITPIEELYTTDIVDEISE
ncbi:MAG: ABC transporter substrate-binding protein, partial [Halanaerobacter sp.]